MTPEKNRGSDAATKVQATSGKMPEPEEREDDSLVLQPDTEPLRRV